MSQNVVNYGIDPSGAQLLDDLLSGEQQNRLTMDSGNSRPPYAEIGTIWTDKSVTGKATLKRFNGTSDDVLMTIDETTGAITIPGIANADLSNLSASGNSKFQEPLVSGTNIKTVNGNSILGSGDISISAGANTDLSNLSITGNDKFVTKDTAQTISAVKTFSAVPIMTGTLTATDNSTNIPTTAWVRNHCCTTAATTTSTASKDAPAYVIENYKSGNNWYRKWSDGWIEQGGLKTGAYANAGENISLNTPFTGTDYTVVVSSVYGNDYTVEAAFYGNDTVISRGTTKFSTSQTGSKFWYACGY